MKRKDNKWMENKSTLKNNNILKFRIILVSLAFGMVLLLSVFLGPAGSVTGADQSANAAGGSADDPFITLSYIDKIFKPAIEEIIDNKLKNLRPAASSSDTPPVQNTYIMSENASVAYVALELTKGQKLRAKSGSLELILRSGTATVVSQFQTQGLADMTSGDELLNAKNVPANHYLLIPRADGRGISVTSAIAYVMARGDYEIYE